MTEASCLHNPQKHRERQIAELLYLSLHLTALKTVSLEDFVIETCFVLSNFIDLSNVHTFKQLI